MDVDCGVVTHNLLLNYSLFKIVRRRYLFGVTGCAEMSLPKNM